MKRRVAIAAFVATTVALSHQSSRAQTTPDEAALRGYAGVYRWQAGGFVYLQLWKEFAGFTKPSQLVAFDEDGTIRVLFPDGRDRFVAGPGAAISDRIESRILFERNTAGSIASITWQRDGGALRTAERVAIERREDIRFSNGGVRLAGTLVSPAGRSKPPAVVLVHGSGPEDRDYILPWARFLIRHGIAVFGYDKRGVGESTGDWTTASFDDLGGDAAAAVEHLKTRADIDGSQIGLLGVSQAGWIMPLAARRAKDIAFVISISGAGVSPAETQLDQARNEMTAAKMRPEAIEQILGLMKLQFQYARTGEGWSEYAEARQKIAVRLGGTPPPSFPGTPDNPQWASMRQVYFHDPAPSLRQLRTPILALFGELDRNITAERNKPALESALAAGNRDYTVRVLAGANHSLWLAKTGTNAEAASLHGFSPEYFAIVKEWLAKRVRGFGAN